VVCPDGMQIIDSDKIVEGQKELLNKNIETIKEVLKITEGEMAEKMKDYSTAMNQQLTEIATLEASSQVYNVAYGNVEGGGGITTYNKATSHIDITITKEKDAIHQSGVVSHELKHGYQYETGKLSLRVNNDNYGQLYDITDETEAYNNQSVLENGAFYKLSIWTDDKVIKHGNTMKPTAYQDLQNSPVDINSEKGKALREKTKQAGKNKTPVEEVYKGWENDYKN
jgi:hypothetical protein